MVFFDKAAKLCKASDDASVVEEYRSFKIILMNGLQKVRLLTLMALVLWYEDQLALFPINPDTLLHMVMLKSDVRTQKKQICLTVCDLEKASFP